MNSKLALVMLTALLSSLLVASACCQTETVGRAPYEFTIHAYTPVRMVVSFAYAENVTHSDVYSSGQSIWRLETSPISATFSTDAQDVFTFTITVNYAVKTNQTIVISVYSGSQQAMDEYRFNVATSQLTFRFKVVTAQEPHFPSVEEYAAVVLERIPTKQDFYELSNHVSHEVDVLNQNAVTMWIVVALNACCAIAALLVALWKRPKEEVWS